MKNRTINIIVIIIFSVFAIFSETFAKASNSDSNKKKKNKKQSEEKAKKNKTEDLSEEELKILEEAREDKMILRKNILGFMKDNIDREAGEGWLYLANHYKELNQLERAREYVDKILRTNNVNVAIKWEASLLDSEILFKMEKYDLALKVLKKLIDSNPARVYLIKAKIAVADIWSRNLTDIQDLYKCLYEYFKPYPEQPDQEAIQYLIGFKQGYDLEIAMRAIEAWEELIDLPESGPANEANMQMAMLYGFDLNNPKRALKYLDNIRKGEEIGRQAIFVKAVLNHLYLTNKEENKENYNKILSDYAEFRESTEDLLGYRVSALMQSYLLSEKMLDYDSAISTLETLQEIPPHLIASVSVSLEKRKAQHDEQIDWAVMANKISGFICEYKTENLDRALYYYKKADELLEERHKKLEDPVLKAAIKRTEPSEDPGTHAYNMAYEKYRSRDYKTAINLYKKFLEEYPNHILTREARFRIAVIYDDDLRNYEKALESYQEYIIKYAPVKSTWNLDTLYDWSRIDEVKYRIGNLLSLHKRNPIEALDIFAQLVSVYPDSYWAQQSLIDSVNIYLDLLKDPEKAYELMNEYIKRYPDNKKSGEYRLKLFNIYKSQGEGVKALHIMRDWLDHTLPSEKGYFENKQKWRDLAFTLRENALRKLLNNVGKNDTVDIYQGLIEVVGLASTTEPLENLISEIKSSETLNDETRWRLVYEAGIELYQNAPEKAEEIFKKLSSQASGTVQLACYMTLGNIAYRATKNIDNAINYYEKATAMLPITDPRNEIPTYRLGRLYLVKGEGLKGLEQLIQFTTRFSYSKYLGKAYIAMGDACVAMHNAERARRYYKHALHVNPELMEIINAKTQNLEKAETSEEWLKARKEELIKAKEKAAKEKENEDNNQKEENNEIKQINDIDKLTEKELAKFSVDIVYQIFLKENDKNQPNFERMGLFLNNILMRSGVKKELLEKAAKQYISTTYFRSKQNETFIKEVPQILQKHNYAKWQSELLFRLAIVYEEEKDYEEANKTFFEYQSFYENGSRNFIIRQKIPDIYEKLNDSKNAYRFYNKLIDDKTIPDEIRTSTSIKKAKLEIKEEKKEEAIKTLEVALSFNSDRRPEICLRLEKLTEDFSYIDRALEYEGKEDYRLKALKRLIKKLEKDGEYSKAAETLSNYAETFTTQEAIIYIEKKVEELGKRGVIENMEELIDRYPEDPKTAERMFRLAKILENTETNENARYTSEDLFYELTLVYPNSVYFKESKIRSENTHSIKSLSELNEMLQKGNKDQTSEEILIEKAHLLQENLKDPKGALENYESFIELFPNSKHIDEVYLNLGDLALNLGKDSKKAINYYEKGIEKSRDNFIRESLVERMNSLKRSDKEAEQSIKNPTKATSIEEIFKVWRLDKNYVYALGLLTNTINKAKKQKDISKLLYYKGRIYEEIKNNTAAIESYEKALQIPVSANSYRKDMLIYRIARLYASNNENDKAVSWYISLTNKYPKSLLSRSAYYWLSKYYNEKENYHNAYNYINRLLDFNSLHPVHRTEISKLAKSIETKLTIKEVQRIKSSSLSDGLEISYLMGKVLENSTEDYDAAIEQYEEYLKESPSKERSRDVMIKIADLYEKKGDYVKSVAYLDKLLDTLPKTAANFNIILRIGNMLEDKIKSNELTELFYDSIAAEYSKVRNIRNFAVEKLKRMYEAKHAQTKAVAVKKITKRVYTDSDKAVLDQMKEIKEKYLDDLQDPKQYERHLEDLWEENSESLATLDIMKTLVALNMNELKDPSKAAVYYEWWLEDNQGDPMYTDITLKLYDHYMKEMRDGQKALRLLEDYIKTHPVSLETLDIEFKVALANETLVRNYDEALRGYQRIIDTQQNTKVVHEAYYRIAFVYRDGYANYTEAIRNWEVLTGTMYYNNEFGDKSQFAIAYTYEAYMRDYTKARAAYNRLLNTFPNSSLQNDARTAILRIEGK